MNSKSSITRFYAPLLFAVIILIASPALAHPGSHSEQTAEGTWLMHLLTHADHLLPIAGAVVLGIVVWRVIHMQQRREQR